MIDLKKASGVPVSDWQKQAWIREMWMYLRDNSDETWVSRQSGDTFLRMRRDGRIISIDEFRVYAGGDYRSEDLEKEFGG